MTSARGRSRSSCARGAVTATASVGRWYGTPIGVARERETRDDAPIEGACATDTGGGAPVYKSTAESTAARPRARARSVRAA